MSTDYMARRYHAGGQFNTQGGYMTNVPKRFNEMTDSELDRHNAEMALDEVKTASANLWDCDVEHLTSDELLELWAIAFRMVDAVQAEMDRRGLPPPAPQPQG